MIKNFDDFVKESFGNRGKGPGNDDLLSTPPRKQVINRSNQTMDLLRIGKQIKTKNIDGFVDSVDKDSIFIIDRLTSEIKKYSFKEVLKEISKFKEPELDYSVKGFEGTPKWAENQNVFESLSDDDYWDSEMDDFDKDKKNNIYYEDENDIDYENDDDKEYDEEYDDENIISDYSEIDSDINDGDDKRNMMLYGSEDNPLGIPNKGTDREYPESNENWEKYWKNFNDKQLNLNINENLEEDEDEAIEEVELKEEPEIIRGTEDNPKPDKDKLKIESY